MSVPVVVVVHGNQGPNSEATIVWDNMFSLPVMYSLVIQQLLWTIRVAVFNRNIPLL